MVIVKNVPQGQLLKMVHLSESLDAIFHWYLLSGLRIVVYVKLQGVQRR